MTHQASLFDRPTTEIEKARNRVMLEARNDGCECPVCGQMVKVYKRNVTSAMARQLIISWCEHQREWFHISTFKKTVTDWAIMAHFDLIEAKEHTPGDEGKKNSGFWRLTKQGEDFVMGRVLVPKYALIYNQRFLGYDGEHVNIKTSLGDRFDYNELMKR